MNIPAAITDRLNTQHLSLTSIIAGLGDEQILHNPQPGKWSIKDNIGHLARYQLVFMDRINKILTTDEPLFEAYRAENDPEFELWLRKSTSQLTRTLKTDRNILTGKLTKLGKDELGRKGIHAKFGSLTILDWTEFFLLHEAHHLFTIFRIAHDPGTN